MGEEIKDFKEEIENQQNSASLQPQNVEVGFELITRAERASGLVVRDDQYDFYWLEEAARKTRKKGYRFSLIDTGFLPSEKIEWLATAGADIYSSDEAQREITQLEFIQVVCRRGRSILAYFFRGSLNSDETSTVGQSLSNLGAQGVFLHLANREEEEIKLMVPLALECRRGGSWLVYYHRGSLEEYLYPLAEAGVWLHLSSQQIRTEKEETVLLELAKLCQKKGGNIILYLENELSLIFLDDLLRAGGFLVFLHQLYDYRSPFRPLQEEARRRKLDWRAYYLYPKLLR